MSFHGAFASHLTVIEEWESKEDYEGSGCAVARGPEGFYWAEYSHCSCYGPEEGLSYDGPYPTHEEARRHISQHLRERLESAWDLSPQYANADNAAKLREYLKKIIK